MAVADTLEITPSAVYQWGELVPPLQAARLAALPNSTLKFDPAKYADWNTSKRSPRTTVIA